MKFVGIFESGELPTYQLMGGWLVREGVPAISKKDLCPTDPKK